MPRIKFYYEVDDGYAGGSRPQHMHVDSEEFEDDMDREAITRYLKEAVQDHFEQHISWFCPEMDDVVGQVQDALKERCDD